MLLINIGLAILSLCVCVLTFVLYTAFKVLYRTALVAEINFRFVQHIMDEQKIEPLTLDASYINILQYLARNNSCILPRGNDYFSYKETFK